ncbi:MAG: CBS domain-containing protein [Hyphomicrobiaceae bacterium]
MKVSEAMHKGVTWVEPTMRLGEVAKLMKQHDVGSLPVGDNDRLVGMITDRDIALKAVARDSGDVRQMTAGDVMTKGIHCCAEADDIEDAVAHMHRYQIRRLPVIDGNKRMVGMLSLGDVSHAAKTDLSGEMIKGVSAHHK